MILEVIGSTPVIHPINKGFISIILLNFKKTNRNNITNQKKKNAIPLNFNLTFKWGLFFNYFVNNYTVFFKTRFYFTTLTKIEASRKKWFLVLVNSTMNPKFYLKSDINRVLSLGSILKMFNVEGKKYRKSKKYHKLIVLYFKTLLNISFTKNKLKESFNSMYFKNIGYFNNIMLFKKIIQLWFSTYNFKKYYFINSQLCSNKLHTTKVKAIKKRLKKRFIKQFYKF